MSIGAGNRPKRFFASAVSSSGFDRPRSSKPAVGCVTYYSICFATSDESDLRPRAHLTSLISLYVLQSRFGYVETRGPLFARPST
ncbi:hypothetical protein EVAR_3685_1 [Eumeta japonica]|uniref:Uncharacterized protein n=1 Tax=Eumeta variegata TaxID=151549 RepID=A0A4C1SRF9_EUMVA|nr:hypothetical protein EVAR_3685_1 [Eumeta japonica]